MRQILILLAFVALGMLGAAWFMRVLPPAVETAVGIVFTLLCLVMFVLIFFAPGIFGRLGQKFRFVWERLRSRRREIEELQRKIAHLDKPHHRVQLGNIYLHQGRYSKAAGWLADAHEREPSLETRYKLALCRFGQHDYEAAAELLEQVHEDKPDHDYGMAYLRLAQAQHFLGHTDRAAEVYETLLRYYPGHPEGCYHYALLSASDGERDKAAEMMREVIRTVRLSPRFQRRRNRHWLLKARWWLLWHGGSSGPSPGSPGSQRQPQASAAQHVPQSQHEDDP